MPLYGFHCAKCDKDFELLIGMSETAVCPTCNSKKLSRLVSRGPARQEQRLPQGDAGSRRP